VISSVSMWKVIYHLDLVDGDYRPDQRKVWKHDLECGSIQFANRDCQDHW